MKISKMFISFSKKASYLAGHPGAFITALSIIVIWAVCGPIFGFNDTWQLVINTSTTIITFLMVFLIQSSQNRDTAALQLKLDELIRVTKGAHNTLLDLEELDEGHLEHYRTEYEKIAQMARNSLKDGLVDTEMAEIDIKRLCDPGKAEYEAQC